MTPEERQDKLQKMTEELHKQIKTVEDAPDTIVAETTEEIQETTPEITEVEKHARELGWQSKEEREAVGKKDTYYVSPEEYINRKPIFEKIQKQKQEMDELREIARQTAANVQAIRDEARLQTIKELEDKKYAAVEIGNVQEVRQIDQQIKNHEQAAQPVQNQVNPELKAVGDEFLSRNSAWYNENTIENKKMVLTAGAIDKVLAQQDYLDGITRSPREHLKRVEEKMRQEYPHRFENSEKDKPNTVGKSTVTRGAVANSNELVSKLTPRQLEFGKRFQRDGILTLEAYAKQLDARGVLGK